MEAALRTAYELASGEVSPGGGQLPRRTCWPSCCRTTDAHSMSRLDARMHASPPTRRRPGEPLPRLEIEEIRGLDGVKEAALAIPATPAAEAAGLAGVTLRVAVASGIGQARHLLQRMAAGEAPAYHFVEASWEWSGRGGWSSPGGWVPEQRALLPALSRRLGRLAACAQPPSPPSRPARRSWPAPAAALAAAVSPRATTRWLCSSACGACVSAGGGPAGGAAVLAGARRLRAVFRSPYAPFPRLY